jgi:tetratricopeptide (TPR) repeat protein
MQKTPFLLLFCILSLSSISLEEATFQYIQNLSTKKRFTEVITESRSFLNRFPLSSFYPRVAILGGEAAYKEKNYYLGKYFFEQAFQKAKETIDLRQSLLGMAKCNYKLGMYSEAARLFETYTKEFDDPIVNPAALYYAQVCALSEGRREEAQRYQQILAQRYPDSPYLNALVIPSTPTPPSQNSVATTAPEPQKQTPTSLNEVSLNMPPLTTQQTPPTTLTLTNWVTISNQVSSPPPTNTISINENERLLSLLEIKAKLLKLKDKALNDKLAELGIRRNP